MVYQYYLPPVGTVPYAALVPVALVTDRWIIIIWVRYSPYTVFITTYHSQEIRIHYCWKLLHELLSKGGKLPEGFEFKVHDFVFGSDEDISRWSEGSGGRHTNIDPSTMQSKSFKNMIAFCKDLANKDPDLNVLIFAVRPDRFAAEPDELGKILSEITTANPRTHVIFTECCGMDPMGWAQRNYRCLLGGRELSKSSSRVNPAKSLKREDWGKEAEERIDEKAGELKKKLIAGEGEAATLLKEAVALGKSTQLQNEPRVTKVKQAIREAQRKDKGLQMDVLMKKLKDKTSVVTGDAMKFDVLFLRWSPNKPLSKILTEEGAHCGQAASCMILREEKSALKSLGVAKVGRLIVIMDSFKSRREVNDGLSLVFRLVLDDQVNAVFTMRFNRINSRLFKEVCEHKKVPIIAKDCLGLSIDDYIAEEESRVEKNSEARKNLNLEHEEEAKTAFAGNHFAELVYNEMKRNSLRKVNNFLVEGLQNLTFGKSGAFEARCRNHEEYRRNMNSSNTGADGQLNDDEDDSDYDYSDSDEEESD